jgi:heat shock protein HspQ
MGFKYAYNNIDAAVFDRIKKFIEDNKEAMSYQKDYVVPAVSMAKVRSFEGIVFDIDPIPVADGAFENAESLYSEWKKADNDYKKSLQIILRLCESGKAKVVTGKTEDKSPQQPNVDPRFDTASPYVFYARKLKRFKLQRFFLWLLKKNVEKYPLVLMEKKQYDVYKKMIKLKNLEENKSERKDG